MPTPLEQWVADNAAGDPARREALVAWLDSDPRLRRKIEVGYDLIPGFANLSVAAGPRRVAPDGALPPLGTGGRDYPLSSSSAAPGRHKAPQPGLLPLHAVAYEVWLKITDFLEATLGIEALTTL